MLGKDEIFGLNINTGKFSCFTEAIAEASVLRKSMTVYVANVHMFMEAQKDKDLFSMINEADVVAPDGLPLCWALKALKRVRQERVAGMDLLPALLHQACSRGLRVFFYGGTGEMLKKAAGYFKEHFPSLQLAGLYSPPFRELTGGELEEVVSRINTSRPDLVFVVLGCPKQEKWIHRMKGRVHGVIIGIGGAFPVLLGLQRRAPRWMQVCGLEWLFRLSQEPYRLLKRYATTNSRFMFMLTKELLGLNRVG
jgi:N-acetylglucosaminyldiphosphoundecaprenol N-acetyl-beta-D-mannosaminyltransferase